METKTCVPTSVTLCQYVIESLEGVTIPMVPSTSLNLKLCWSCHAFNFDLSFLKKHLRMGAFMKRLNFFSSWIDRHLRPWHSPQHRFLLARVITVRSQIFAALHWTCREVESEKKSFFFFSIIIRAPLFLHSGEHFESVHVSWISENSASLWVCIRTLSPLRITCVKWRGRDTGPEHNITFQLLCILADYPD